MKAIYIGPDHTTFPNYTIGKSYEVKQYETASDPVYGNTWLVLDDDSTEKIASKFWFNLPIGKDLNTK